MNPEQLRLQVERLLRSCAILPSLKGFYPLRDLVLLYYHGIISPQAPRKAAMYLVPLYGKEYRGNIRHALRHSWSRPECRLTELVGLGVLDEPPTVDVFALALCRNITTPA